jgi:3-oxoacyl-[acyl-carrier-protein] synthase II
MRYVVSIIGGVNSVQSFVGVLVLETLEHAQKRGAPIIAEYLGGAVTCDAYHMTDPRKDGLGVSSCIELALKDAGIERDQV